jgi:hypothetical protein
MPINRQLVFDRTVERAKDPRRATANADETIGGMPVCLYRAAGGLACFFGALIPDDRYNPRMEGRSVQTTDAYYLSTDLFVGGERDAEFDGADVDFLRDLQRVHDREVPEYWKKSLLNVAKVYALSAVTAEKLP